MTDADPAQEDAVEHALDPHPFAATEALVETDEPVQAIEEKAARLREDADE
jgi:hypothetical protein